MILVTHIISTVVVCHLLSTQRLQEAIDTRNSHHKHGSCMSFTLYSTPPGNTILVTHIISTVVVCHLLSTQRLQETIDTRNSHHKHGSCMSFTLYSTPPGNTILVTHIISTVVVATSSQPHVTLRVRRVCKQQINTCSNSRSTHVSK